jgi:hypothetical protein
LVSQESSDGGPDPNNQQGRHMGIFSKDIETMDDLFVHTLRDIYYAENQIVKALPDMIEKASDPGLKQGFQTHLGETRNHVKRLEQIFEMHGVEKGGIDALRLFDRLGKATRAERLRQPSSGDPRRGEGR